MRRREFITILGGAAATWPLAARAQGSTKRPLVAWLGLGTQPGSSVFVDAFLQGMRELGYAEGHDFDFVYRFADGYIEQLPTLADEVVRLHPAVILAAASGPAVAARKATATIPIVTPALADFQLPTIFTPTMAPNSISVRRDSPRHMTVFPGGGSLARAR